jgi:hypothetical protein
MRFSRFFSIEIRHEYYDNALCTDLQAAPTPACAALMSKCKMMFDPSPINPGVIAKLNDSDQLLSPPPANAAFDFYLLLSNPDFFTYTSPLPDSTSKAFQFTNRDAKSKPLTALLSSSIPKPQPSYVDGKPVFGIVRIVADATFPMTYSLSFKAANLKWRYYLIAGSNLNNLSIDGTTSDIKFIKTTSGGKPVGDKIYDAITSNFPDASLSIFESEKEVSLRQAGRKSIQLINTSNNVVLVPNLPNPALRENGIKIINTLS